MKKLYANKDEANAARRARRAAERERTRLKEKYILKTITCWLWIGTKWKSGYGQVRVGNKSIAAHRYIYEQYKGPIPEGLDILHSCDNPSCVNPEHLRAGTHSENMKDAYKRGRRSSKGVSNGNYKHGKYINEDLY